MYTITIILALNLPISYQKCMMYQPGTTIKPEKATTDEQKTPELYDKPEEFNPVCPDFIGKQVCCKGNSRKLMAVNFLKLGLIVECQNCKNNIQRMMYE